MANISVNVSAIRLSLRTLPVLKTTFEQRSPTQPAWHADKQLKLEMPSLPGFAEGVMPPGWDTAAISKAFTDANEIWIREAGIEFKVVETIEHTAIVSEDPDQMWIDLINHLPSVAGKVKCAFVHDLHAEEGGWGGGRLTAVSYAKGRQGQLNYGGALLAHELGHVLMDDQDHKMARGDIRNLMYQSMKPEHFFKRFLYPEQVQLAQRVARTL